MVGNRDDLIEGAIRSIQENGYSGSTARELARLSNTSLAAIGYHFGSKEALLNEALGVAFRRWVDRLATLPAALDGSPRAELSVHLLEEIRQLFDADRPLLVAFFDALAHAQQAPELRSQLAAQYDEVRTSIASIVAALFGADIDAQHARASASLLMAIIDGLAVQHLLDPDAAPAGSEVVAAIEALTEGRRQVHH